jgi:ubiquinone/menaquinone biosynthesis C-methylase UbiE
MGAQMVLSLLLGAFCGAMEAMVPGMFVGMLGMVLPVFHLPNLRIELLLGSGIGFLVFLFFSSWNESIEGTTLTVPPPGPPKRSNVPSMLWYRFAWFYDAMEKGGSRRQARFQKDIFQTMRGKVLFVAAGTGLNFPNFPHGKDIFAIDLSSSMVKAARAKGVEYKGSLSVQQADVQVLPFASSSFDTVATACTFCSVADPAQGLKELYRVLKPSGTVLMFEHVRSRKPLLGLSLDFLTLVTRYIGPAMNRDTVGNVQRAGFVVDRVVCAYLDIFLAIEAHKPWKDISFPPKADNIKELIQ